MKKSKKTHIIFIFQTYLDYLLFNYYSILFCATPCSSREATVLSTSSRKVLCTSQSFSYMTDLSTYPYATVLSTSLRRVLCMPFDRHVAETEWNAIDITTCALIF